MSITSCKNGLLLGGWRMHGFKFLQADFIQKAGLKRHNYLYYTPALFLVV